MMHKNPLTLFTLLFRNLSFFTKSFSMRESEFLLYSNSTFTILDEKKPQVTVTRLGLLGRLCVPQLAQAYFFYKKIKCCKMFFYVCNTVLPKIGHHISNKMISKLKLSKNVSQKTCGPKLIFFNEKNLKRFEPFFTQKIAFECPKLEPIRKEWASSFFE